MPLHCRFSSIRSIASERSSSSSSRRFTPKDQIQESSPPFSSRSARIEPRGVKGDWQSSVACKSEIVSFPFPSPTSSPVCSSLLSLSQSFTLSLRLTTSFENSKSEIEKSIFSFFALESHSLYSFPSLILHNP